MDEDDDNEEEDDGEGKAKTSTASTLSRRTLSKKACWVSPACSSSSLIRSAALGCGFGSPTEGRGSLEVAAAPGFRPKAAAVVAVISPAALAAAATAYSGRGET